jgi:hypothetical protein
MSSGLKAGLCLGIVAAVVLGIGAGWFIFGRAEKQDMNIPMNSAIRNKFNELESWHRLSGKGSAPSMYELENWRRLNGSGVAPSMYELEGSDR